MSKKHVAIILAGNGNKDGSEIHESALTFYFLDKKDIKYSCYSIDAPQLHVLNYTTNQPMDEQRNILEESARLARGSIQCIEKIDAYAYDGLIIPGGLGAIKHLCNYYDKQQECIVHPSVEALIKNMHKLKKPMGFICIAPVLAAALIKGAQITCGPDKETSQIVTQMGAQPIEVPVDDVVIDPAHNIISTPAFMDPNARISHIAKGIEKLVEELWIRL